MLSKSKGSDSDTQHDLMFSFPFLFFILLTDSGWIDPLRQGGRIRYCNKCGVALSFISALNQLPNTVLGKQYHFLVQL